MDVWMISPPTFFLDFKRSSNWNNNFWFLGSRFSLSLQVPLESNKISIAWHEQRVTPPKTNMKIEKNNQLKMYFLLKEGDFPLPR